MQERTSPSPINRESPTELYEKTLAQIREGYRTRAAEKSQNALAVYQREIELYQGDLERSLAQSPAEALQTTILPKSRCFQTFLVEYDPGNYFLALHLGRMGENDLFLETEAKQTPYFYERTSPADSLPPTVKGIEIKNNQINGILGILEEASTEHHQMPPPPESKYVIPEGFFVFKYRTRPIGKPGDLYDLPDFYPFTTIIKAECLEKALKELSQINGWHFVYDGPITAITKEGEQILETNMGVRDITIVGVDGVRFPPS